MSKTPSILPLLYRPLGAWALALALPGLGSSCGPQCLDDTCGDDAGTRSALPVADDSGQSGVDPLVPGGDGGASADAGTRDDGGAAEDGGPLFDGGGDADGGGDVDGGAALDGGDEVDGGSSSDGGDPPDGGSLVDAGGTVEVTVPFTDGRLDNAPQVSDLLPLPGGGEGGPVIVSNNPEKFTGPGVLMGTGRPLLTRGGQTTPLSGNFGVYLHHLVDTSDSSPLWVTLLVSNPGQNTVNVRVRGTGLAQEGGLPIGGSPDYLVSEDWIRNTPATNAEADLAQYQAFIAWQVQVPDGKEVDGRFGFETDGNVYVYIVATTDPDINECVRMTSGPPVAEGGIRVDAPGDYVTSNPLGANGGPVTFGREAGVYDHDTWRGTLDVTLPAAEGHVGFIVNTATRAVSAGSNELVYPDVQAFPALMHLDGSAAEAVGMYGNIYDLTVTLRHDGDGTQPRRARVKFWSLGGGTCNDAGVCSPSRLWDGVGLIDGQAVDLQHTPAVRATTLKEVVVQPGVTQTVRLQAMVPGLTSIPQALTVESLE